LFAAWEVAEEVQLVVVAVVVAVVVVQGVVVVVVVVVVDSPELCQRKPFVDISYRKHLGLAAEEEVVVMIDANSNENHSTV
jgi:hypothetical protein